MFLSGKRKQVDLDQLWNLETRSVAMKFEGHEEIIYDIDYAPSGKYLVSASFDRTIRTWCTDSGREELQLSNADRYTSVTFSSDGLLLAGASLDKSIRVWIAQTGQLIAHLASGRVGMVMDKTLLDGHTDSVYHVAFNMHGTALFSASLDKTVKIWEGLQITDDDANMTVKTLKGHKVYYNHPSYLLVWFR